MDSRRHTNRLEALKRFENVIGGHHKSGTIADQLSGLMCSGVKRRAWIGEDIAVLFRGELRRRKRAETFGGLDQDHVERQIGDNAVATWEMQPLQFGAFRSAPSCGAGEAVSIFFAPLLFELPWLWMD
jgi:hypothetical protein